MPKSLDMRDDDFEEDATKKLNIILSNDPTFTELKLTLSANPASTFFNNLAKALQHNSNIKHLSIEDGNFKKCLPNDMFVIFGGGDKYDGSLATYNVVFDSLIKSKKTKIRKLTMDVREDSAEPLTKFLAANMMIENQMLKLILQPKIGAEAANKISDELYSTNSIRELHLTCLHDLSDYRSLLEALETNRYLESLSISFYYDELSDDFKFIAALDKILLCNKVLKKLELVMTGFDPYYLRDIAMVIQNKSSLESFRFLVSYRRPCNIEVDIKQWFAKISNQLHFEFRFFDIPFETFSGGAYYTIEIRSKCFE